MTAAGRRRSPRRSSAWRIVPPAGAALLASCAGAQSALDPAGPQAAGIARLWWVMFGLGAAVAVIVIAVMFVALFHRGGSRPGAGRAPERARDAEPREVDHGDAASPDAASRDTASGDTASRDTASHGDVPSSAPASAAAADGDSDPRPWNIPPPAIRAGEPGDRRAAWVIGGGVAATLVIIVVLVFYSVLLTRDTTRLGGEDALVIEITGHQFWWEIRYAHPEPNLRVTTANELHIPAGVPVHLRLRSRDVIHSVWIPNLHGKIDLVPGHENVLRLQADAPGRWRGQCAEYCGMQHAKMGLIVVATAPDEFETWLELQRQPARPPEDPVARRGSEVFADAQCAYCHAIRGTPALAQVAPDLTHLASRSTLAAGILPNTRGHLGGWIANPQAIKPGSRMPATPLAAEDLQALLVYLETLR